MYIHGLFLNQPKKNSTNKQKPTQAECVWISGRFQKHRNNFVLFPHRTNAVHRGSQELFQEIKALGAVKGVRGEVPDFCPQNRERCSPCAGYGFAGGPFQLSLVVKSTDCFSQSVRTSGLNREPLKVASYSPPAADIFATSLAGSHSEGLSTSPDECTPLPDARLRTALPLMTIAIICQALRMGQQWAKHL